MVATEHVVSVAAASRYHSRMPKLLLNLRHVPDDESEEVGALLDAHQIAWYQTPPNRWGISAGGIWIRDEADFPRARAAMDVYQAQRAERVRAEWAKAKASGTAPSLLDVVRANPLGMLATAVAILLLLGLMVLVPLGLWVKG
jgi:hypothetical protein